MPESPPDPTYTGLESIDMVIASGLEIRLRPTTISRLWRATIRSRGGDTVRTVEAPSAQAAFSEAYAQLLEDARSGPPTERQPGGFTRLQYTTGEGQSALYQEAASYIARSTGVANGNYWLGTPTP